MTSLHCDCRETYQTYATPAIYRETPKNAQNLSVTRSPTFLFVIKKPGDLLLLIAVTITIAFYCFHSGVTPPGWGVTFLPVRPRFSTILCRFVHKNFVPSGVTPCRVSPGAVRSPAPL